MSNIALITSAGRGRRMQAAGPKQYLLLRGEPILVHTLRLFQSHPLIDAIVLVVPEAEIPYCQQELVDANHFDKVVALVAGGAERQDSVRNGLEACNAAADDLVLVHDGVRPLFDPDQLQPLLQTAASTGAALVGVPVKETIKQVEDGRVVATPSRKSLWAAQTPQAFRFELLARAHQQARERGYSGTDDAALVEWLGETVAMVPGDYRNLKITTPEDLVLAEGLMQQKEARP